MKEIIKSLTSLDKQIEDAKRNIAVQEGRLEETVKQLKDEFGLDTIVEAEELEMKEKAELESLSKDIEQRFSKLKEKYEW